MASEKAIIHALPKTYLDDYFLKCGLAFHASVSQGGQVTRGHVYLCSSLNLA